MGNKSRFTWSCWRLLIQPKKPSTRKLKIFNFLQFSFAFAFALRLSVVRANVPLCFHPCLRYGGRAFVACICVCFSVIVVLVVLMHFWVLQTYTFYHPSFLIFCAVSCVHSQMLVLTFAFSSHAWDLEVEPCFIRDVNTKGLITQFKQFRGKRKDQWSLCSLLSLDRKQEKKQNF